VIISKAKLQHIDTTLHASYRVVSNTKYNLNSSTITKYYVEEPIFFFYWWGKCTFVYFYYLKNVDIIEGWVKFGMILFYRTSQILQFVCACLSCYTIWQWSCGRM